MKTLNRWILENNQGKKIKAFQTSLGQGYLVYFSDSQRFALVEKFEKSKFKLDESASIIGEFSQNKILSLKNGFILKPAEAHDTLDPVSAPLSNDEDDKKSALTYYKKSAIAHVAAVLILMLGVHFLTNSPKTDDPVSTKVSLVELPKAPVQVVKAKPQVTKKVVRKVTPTKNKKRSRQVRTRDNQPNKQFALLQGLEQNVRKQNSRKQVIQSAGQNQNSGGGLTGGTTGGSPTKVANSGMRAGKTGKGSISSATSAGYGSGMGGSQGASGLNVVSNQRGFSLPSGPEDSFSASGLDRDQIIAVINRHRGEITYCYEQALKQDPSVRGKVAIKFVINPNGRVARANIAESSANHSRLESCMVARLRTWQFPKPVGSVNVDVLYPFHLTKLGQR